MVDDSRTTAGAVYYLKKALTTKHSEKAGVKGELRAKFHPNFFFIYRFVYAYYNVMQNIIIFGKGFRKL